MAVQQHELPPQGQSGKPPFDLIDVEALAELADVADEVILACGGRVREQPWANLAPCLLTKALPSLRLHRPLQFLGRRLHRHHAETT